MENWFCTKQIDENTFVISEPNHWEETNCYLLLGKENALLIDTGLGVSDISEEKIKKLAYPYFILAFKIYALSKNNLFCLFVFGKSTQ